MQSPTNGQVPPNAESESRVSTPRHIVEDEGPCLQTQETEGVDRALPSDDVRSEDVIYAATESLSVRRSSVAGTISVIEIRPQNSRDALRESASTAAETKEELAEAQFATLRLLRPWFPEADPEHERAHTFRTWRSRRDVVMQACSVTSVVIFLINLSCTILFKAKWGSDGDINACYHGDCLKAGRISTGLHVMINLLSTLLLGASNLCMQLLAAPRRSEVDRAHRNFVWLHIGVPSLRNLRHIGRERLVICAILAMSSVPLHFLYNSAVFPTLASNSYNWVVVTPAYLNNAPWDLNATNKTLREAGNEEVLGLKGDSGLPVMHPLAASINQAPWPTYEDIAQMQTTVRNVTGLTKLSPLDCLEQYSTPFGDRSDLILIAQNTNTTKKANNSLLACGTQGSVDKGAHKGNHPGEWMCRQSNTFSCKKLAAHGYESEDQKISAIAHWNIVGYEIDYCMASYRPTGNRCGVVYSYRIMVVVCCANFCKCLAILYTAIRYSKHTDPPLWILGDALASFLKRPDIHTKGMAIVSYNDIQADCDRAWKRPVPKEWRPLSQRWVLAASRLRWFFGLLLTALVFLVAVILLHVGIRTLQVEGAPTGLKSLLRLGLGNVNFNTLVNFLPHAPGNQALYSNIFFANLWQIIISLLYVTLNALFSCLLVSDEWMGFHKMRKTLRVSFPEGIQRSSYFISMPFRYGIPLTTSMALLHWTVSQSVFVVRVISHYSDGSLDAGSTITAAGYSPLGIMISLTIGLILISTLLLLGLRKFPSGMPLASTCSAAISAACHPPLPEDEEAYMFPVQWGVVSQDAEDVGHCSFTTARDVAAPVVGRLYS